MFVSFAEPDVEIARSVFEFVETQLGRRAFFAPVTAPKHPGIWSQTINSAVKSASCFIAVGTSVEHFERDWVQYEIGAFHQLHLKDRNPPMTIASLIFSFNPQLLPLPLRLYTAFSWDKIGFDAALEELRKIIPARPRDRGATA